MRECFAFSRTRAGVIQLDILISAQAMLWGTFLRTAELLEEELIEEGAAGKADVVRQVRIAAEAVRESRQLKS